MNNKAENKAERYRSQLAALQDWDRFLLEESGLPGPRGNLELAQVVADEGQLPLFERYLQFDAQRAPVNSPEEFLPFCAVVGLGRLAAEGDWSLLEHVRPFASDQRWRMREGVAMALQRVGKRNMPRLIQTAQAWITGNRYEQRAAAAALAEPALLKDDRFAHPILSIFDQITTSCQSAEDRKTEAFQVLRKGLGYAWSVVVAAYPEPGLPRMEYWMASKDPDIRWIMKENLKKERLARISLDWVTYWHETLG